MSHKYITAVCAAVAVMVLAGCSSPAMITLKDGRQLETTSQPKYDENSGFYEFKQQDGKTVQINKDEIHTIKKM